MWDLSLGIPFCCKLNVRSRCVKQEKRKGVPLALQTAVECLVSQVLAAQLIRPAMPLVLCRHGACHWGDAGVVQAWSVPLRWCWCCAGMECAIEVMLVVLCRHGACHWGDAGGVQAWSVPLRWCWCCCAGMERAIEVMLVLLCRHGACHWGDAGVVVQAWSVPLRWCWCCVGMERAIEVMLVVLCRHGACHWGDAGGDWCCAGMERDIEVMLVLLCRHGAWHWGDAGVVVQAWSVPLRWCWWRCSPTCSGTTPRAHPPSSQMDPAMVHRMATARRAATVTPALPLPAMTLTCREMTLNLTTRCQVRGAVVMVSGQVPSLSGPPADSATGRASVRDYFKFKEVHRTPRCKFYRVLGPF